MTNTSSLPQKNQRFVETRKRLYLTIPEFALLLRLSTEEVVLVECGKKLVNDSIGEKLEHLSRISLTPKQETPNNYLKETSQANSKYDTNNPLLAIFKEVQIIQEKINGSTPPKKKRPTRVKRGKKDPSQLSLMFAIKEAKYPNESVTENAQPQPEEGECGQAGDNKTYLLRRIHAELNQFNKHFNHYTQHNHRRRATDPASQAVFFELKQIRDDFTRELFQLQEIITTDSLPFIDLLKKIDFTSRLYADKMLLKLKENSSDLPFVCLQHYHI